MRMPNKVDSYNRSVVSLFVPILEALRTEAKEPSALLRGLSRNKTELGNCIDALICLYAMGKIDFCENTGALKYVEAHKL